MVSPKARKRPVWVGDMAICASGAHRSSHHIPKLFYGPFEPAPTGIYFVLTN
jgi:hypothetical protein